MLTQGTVTAIQKALVEAKLDGWLIYDFHGLNPVASGIVGVKGMGTRRIFVLIPREGPPVAITHAIEQDPWRDWPASWVKTTYSSWRSLESQVRDNVAGKRLAMEYSPGDAVPYLDRVPAGVLEMVREAGATVVSSADLVTRFYAVWSEENLASHVRAADIIARVAKDAFRKVGESLRDNSLLTEFQLKQWILGAIAAAGLETDHGPIVAIGPSAANAHYEPMAEHSAQIRKGDTLLIDLWAREPDGVFADQTWMASLGPPSSRDESVWYAIRDARDAAIALLRERIGAGKAVRGGEVDDAAREVIRSRGFGDYFVHRTGHSIDSRDLHGSGPHIDNLETREERLLIPGIGFSLEPGIYLPGELGMRTEVNAYVGDGELVITPSEIQKELIII